MKISAVISEFNPMHEGHVHLINCARGNGATHIVSFMSGNFVQRGDCAIYPKWDRAAQAIMNGVDLVIEIPDSKALSSASNYANAGVYIAQKCGCIDELFFGSECGDIEKLKKIAEIISSENFSKLFEEEYAKGVSYPSARMKAFEKAGERELAIILENPNDILAVEYIKSLIKNQSKITPVCFQRIGADHDSLTETSPILSAAMIREKIFNGEIDPKFSVHSLKNVERAILYKLREMTVDDLKNLPDVDEGLENRFKECIKKYNSVSDIIEGVKTKRYTYSRLRRIVLCALLSIKRGDVYSPVSFLKVLAFNERGREILKIMKDTASLPIIQKHSDIYKTGNEKVIRDYEKEAVNSDIYALMSEDVESCSRQQRENAIFVKNIDK